ncbi:MAG TPA: folylpolyglutamate synthase/dihydrofolate synthase family protein [Alphaproteobacteria bacterium]|nr:folylpolyglutamate synthase/dihydrofolate synthase family protein [Alphaproteobacteria bacterium]
MAAKSDAVLERLQGLHPKIIDLSLDRTVRLLGRLGNPQLKMPPVIHVAGTNGKGSTVAFLRAMLEAAGKRVHVYTSPHLVRFHERIRLAGELISEDALLEMLDRCEQANGGDNITYFEITTAAAFLAFSEVPADVTLLEVGLGGRFDATNVIDKPMATVITPVSMDHEQYLGDTLAQIAFEKAGILKAGVPGIIGAQAPEALKVIEARAAEIGAPLFRMNEDWTAAATARGLRFKSGAKQLNLPLPNLLGAHQIANAGAAVATLQSLPQLKVPESALAGGLTQAQWPARLQRLTKGPLVEMLPRHVELWLDGGHNPSAGEALAKQAQQWHNEPLFIVSGLLRTKDAAGFFKPLAIYVQEARSVAIPDATATLSAEETAEAAKRAGMDAPPMPSLAEAIRSLLPSIEGPARILICGSLYLAGHVLAENG